MIDTVIRFNDHNSYKITTPVFCYPFGVESMDYITHSFQAYAMSMLASATRAKTKFFDANGLIVSDVSHDFAVTAVFGKVDISVAVPATAVQAQLVFLHGGTDWWVAEPKSEQGQTATPYNVNYQGQLTYITPNGIYTGMMTTGQIVVVGTTGKPNETLDTRLITISNGMINLTATVSGKLGAGVDYAGVKIDAVNGFTSTTSIAGKTIVTKANSVDGISIYSGTDKMFGVSIDGHVFANRLADPDDPLVYAQVGKADAETSIFGIYRKITPSDPIFRKKLEIRAYSNTATTIEVPVKRIGVNEDGSTLFNLSHGDAQVTLWGLYGGGGQVTLTCNDAKINVNSSSGPVMSFSDNSGNKLGVDANGPYYQKNFVKTYF